MITAERLRESYHLNSSRDLDPLMEKTGEARYVLLGEASHGTHEFYTWRTAISQRLIREQGFTFIAVEGDWPDCYQINRFVKGYTDPQTSARDILKEFERWPTWMWANWEIAALMEWMKEYNSSQPPERKVGFYGLDVYSLWESMDTIVNYLRKEDPASAKLAIAAMRCFEPYNEGQDYAHAMLSLSADCRNEVVNLLQAVRRRSRNYDHDPEAALNAEMNAQVIAHAEEYYRSMVSFQDKSWNLRDMHMVQALETIMKFHGKKAKGIIWEHNTHVGDARFTDMTHAGMLNVGQLVRERHMQNGEVVIVGFSSYEGSVIAAREWGSEMSEMVVPPAMEGSLEHLLHNDSTLNKLILLDTDYWQKRLQQPLGHRAIGVVYQPEDESQNYVRTIAAGRYDAMIFIDKSTALHPLHIKSDRREMPETYPFGF
jgi:erythromycin esterase